jgi:hypothetical protein
MIIIESDDYHSESKTLWSHKKWNRIHKKTMEMHRKVTDQEFSEIGAPIGNDRSSQKITSQDEIEYFDFRREISSWQILPDELRRHRPPIRKPYVVDLC